MKKNLLIGIFSALAGLGLSPILMNVLMKYLPPALRPPLPPAPMQALKPPSKAERLNSFITCFREEFSPSDGQLKDIQERILKDDNEVLEAAKKLTSTHEELEIKLESEASEAEVLNLFYQVTSLQNKLSENHFKKMLVLRETLTPQQRLKFLVCKRRLAPPQLPPHE